MTTTGRAALFFGPGKPFELTELPVPDPEPGAVVVRVTRANICGSDLHIWRGDGFLSAMARADGRIVGHSDVAPERKDDPGELFPWKRLAQAGHGLWVEAPPAPGEPLAEGAEGVGVFALQAGFTRLGYDLPPSGKFDADTKAVVTAFQRHWRQETVDGIADGETRARLIGLLRLGA